MNDLAYLSTEEAAHLINVHPNTIVRWIKSGKLPSSKIGREYCIPREAIEIRGKRAAPSTWRRVCLNRGINALTAAKELLIPMAMEYLALRELDMLAKTVAKVRVVTNSELKQIKLSCPKFGPNKGPKHNHRTVDISRFG